MNPIIFIIILATIISGVITIMISSHWLLIWIGFEMKMLAIIGEGNGTPLQYSCLENPMGGGAW